MIKPQNVLVLPDTHIRRKKGGQDQRSIDAVLKYASDHTWTQVVHLGDIVDHNSISLHNKGNLRSIEGETLWADYDVANKVLDDLEQATPGAEKYLIEGNHDYRATRVAEEQPQLTGLIETEIGLKVAERGWNWVPYWSKGKTLDLGKASFGHGRYTTKHHALQHALRYGRNFFYGHVHDVQAHTMERDGNDRKYEAASLGCLCEYDQNYLKGSPTKWQQNFGVFRFQSNGFFNRFDIRLFNHGFTSPEGKYYQG